MDTYINHQSWAQVMGTHINHQSWAKAIMGTYINQQSWVQSYGHISTNRAGHKPSWAYINHQSWAQVIMGVYQPPELGTSEPYPATQGRG